MFQWASLDAGQGGAMQKGQVRTGLGSVCKECGGRLISTGQERSRQESGFGTRPQNPVRSAEYACEGCGRMEWCDLGDEE